MKLKFALCFLSIFILIILFLIINNFGRNVQIEFFEQNGSNIPSEPTQPSDEEKNQPGYLDLQKLTIPDIKNYVVRTVSNAIQSVRPDTQGPAGTQGPQGPKGENGGIFVEKGPIRSVKEPSLFLDRGTNNPNLNKRTYKPSQSWILDSGNKLRSFYDQNQCLSFKDNTVLMSNCATSENWNYIGRTSQLRSMRPVGGKNKCLIMNDNPEAGTKARYSLSMGDCNVSPNQAWSFS